MIKVFWIFILTTVFAGAQPAQKSVSLEEHLQKVVLSEVQKECTTCTIDLLIHNKQSVEDVAIPDQVIADRWRGQTNLVLKLGKENRLVTVTIRWKDKVVVAKKNIRQGHLLNGALLKTVEKDVTFLQTPYLQNIENALGFETRRIFQRGQVIDESFLKKPLVVKFGQPVKVHVNEGALELSILGQARGAGAIGDRIPVYVTSTRKKVFAVIVDKSTVRVE